MKKDFVRSAIVLAPALCVSLRDVDQSRLHACDFRLKYRKFPQVTLMPQDPALFQAKPQPLLLQVQQPPFPQIVEESHGFWQLLAMQQAQEMQTSGG